MWVDEGEPRRAGTLRPSFMGRTLAACSFVYDDAFLADGYELSPDLPLVRGRTYTPESSTLFGALSDVAPDEWGQRIIRSAISQATDGDRTAAPNELDYLLGVSDATRMGALRLRLAGTTEWATSDRATANVHELDRILAAARRYEANEASEEDIDYLDGVATSPGGARPKANVTLGDGTLAIAKLPHSKDGSLDVERWEAVALTLASNAGINTPRFEIAAGESRKAVLLTHRFDRRGVTRAGYVSAATAMSLGSHRTGNELSYLEFADTVAELSASPRAELRELFTRIALTVLVNNVDDHWRNHGFLRSAEGWRLSPVFDVNPAPATRTVHSRPIAPGTSPDERRIEDLLAAADAFQLTLEEAGSITAAVGASVAEWPSVARALGVDERELGVMASAFEEAQLEVAREGAQLSSPSTIDLGERPAARASGEMWVSPHRRNGKDIAGHWRASPRSS